MPRWAIPAKEVTKKFPQQLIMFGVDAGMMYFCVLSLLHDSWRFVEWLQNIIVNDVLSCHELLWWLLAQRPQVALLPVVIHGAYELWPPGRLFTSPGEVSRTYPSHLHGALGHKSLT